MIKSTFLPALTTGIAVMFAMSAPTARAVEFDSVFVDYNLKDCITPAGGVEHNETYCQSKNNIPTYLSLTGPEYRPRISYGASGKNELAATEFPPGAISVEHHVEWRLSNAEGRWQTFAAIQNWFTMDERSIKGETLVITKVENGNTCHTAYIDAVITPNVHDRARKIADLCVPKFRCGVDKPLRIAGPEDPDQNKICTRSWAGFFTGLNLAKKAK